MRKIYTILLSVILLLLGSLTVCASTGGNTVTVDNVSDLTTVLKSGGDSSAPLTVVLEESATPYNISSMLVIPSYITLDLNGQTVAASSEYYVFNLKGTDAAITNGTINNAGIRFANGASITKLVINKAPENGIYANGGSLSGDISGNTISGSVGMGIYMFGNSSCGNITDNTVTGCGNHAIRLSGSSNSAAASNTGCSAGNITGNVIKSCRGHGISLYHGSTCGKISLNRLTDIGGANKEGDYGIAVNSSCPYISSAAEITNNTISRVTSAGISVFSGPGDKPTSSIYQDNGRVTGDIAYNTISYACTDNKGLNWSKSGTLPICRAAIHIDNHARVFGNVHHNTIDQAYANGINVISYSKVKNINSNTVKNAHNAAVSIANNGKVLGNISKNTLKNSYVYGILVNNSSSVPYKITGNTIAPYKGSGISVMKKASVGTITSNTITAAKEYGIIAAGGGAKIKQAISNTISVKTAAGYGIYCNSGCSIATIKSNRITGKYAAGIGIKEASAPTLITYNTLTAGSTNKAKSMGISAIGNKTKTVTVKKNKITGNRTAAGVYMKTTKGVVKSNTIKKVSKKIIVVKGKYKVSR